ncbi:alkaline phosphatase D family protein [uncultured Aquimarina sp.]|uniref:alkaline phosphatase D family protein n=1 Tax=uncultured Aquimarina sp. TaxID=575652 RepID=UPI00261B1FAF|nr:alkaline phosphatase D family protein [uncultured Aquimarina sp.]
MKKACYFLILSTLLLGCSNKKSQKETASDPTYIESPFTGIDTIATNDWWNRKSNTIIDVKVPRGEVIAFGIYTVSNETLKLTAQLFPLYPDETREVRLEIKENGTWREVQKKMVNELGWSATFRINNWNYKENISYRILHSTEARYEGVIRRDPTDKDEITLAALSCNSNKDRGDRDNYIRNINFQDPDLVFFAGDQSYDHQEHTAAWLKFGLQFREVFRNRPCITIPDDHDIGQGNLWGEYGKKASTMAGDDGGYFYHPEYVKMVERCQTAHLPDPYDPTPIQQDIGVYYTNLIWGGVDFAIIEDRKFKSGPKGKIPQIGPRPDHIRDPNYDPNTVDLEGLELLGNRQLEFLKSWGSNQQTTDFKVVLSQTGFCGGAHLHGSLDNRLHADMDSNGWPQKGRNRALEAIKNSNAIHIAGDQHLATVIQHGIESYDDGPWAFVVPAIVNNFYSRWWWPEDAKPATSSDKLPWIGKYLDGFHNKITMHAYANPDSPSNGAGYGMIRFRKNEKTVTFECWPRFEDVRKKGAKQFIGWPITIEIE